MTSVVFYFQVHQPFRLKHFTFFDIGSGAGWFDDQENERILRRVAERCYLPVNALLLRKIEEHSGRFKVAYSISGTALEQMERWTPEALASFQSLAATGCVEFLGETSHHSLASVASLDEFARQVEEHAARVEQLFGVRPTTFRNTELVVSNAIARRVEELGFTAILGEGADPLLGWRSPHRVYRPQGCKSIKLLLRSYRYSDDIAFRFSNREWPEWPLTPERYARWLAGADPQDAQIGLFMDYETFGEHQWEETGILRFMDDLPSAVLAHSNLDFATPREVAAAHDAVAELDIPRPISWADAERDLSAWLGNAMQTAAHEALYALLPEVIRSAGSRAASTSRARRGSARIQGSQGNTSRASRDGVLEKWRKLSTSDHVYYMCTKWFSDGDVHKYFSPYATPHDAFISFMNVLDDLAREIGPARERAAAAPAHE